jgi:hypothetical protein
MGNICVYGVYGEFAELGPYGPHLQNTYMVALQRIEEPVVQMK